jgi:DNA-binding NarL/FixJ family response regulator
MKAGHLKILLVDDHTLVRRALARLIGTLDYSTSIFEAANGFEALEMASKNEIDLVILDVQMPRMSGIDVIKALRTSGNHVKILVLTQFDNESLVAHLIQLGVNGFLSKNASPEELDIAITTLGEKSFFYNELTQGAIRRSFSKNTNAINLNFSPRELQVVSQLKDGKSSKEIAIDLGLALTTVETYRKSILKKAKARNIAELICLVNNTGII